MQIIPVLDIQHGMVVRGVGGQRELYRPIQSRLSSSSMPADVACALQDEFGFTHFYLADLDAIAAKPPCTQLYTDLHLCGFELLVDAGVANVGDIQPLMEVGVTSVVVGLETVAGPDELQNICKTVPAEHIVFSLDLKHGEPMTQPQVWPTDKPQEIARIAVSYGIRQMIVLDLAHVGMDGGTGTEKLCRSLLKSHPELKLIAGGGIRGRDDLLRLNEIGVHGVLVASALHDGGLQKSDIDYVGGLNSTMADCPTFSSTSTRNTSGT